MDTFGSTILHASAAQAGAAAKGAEHRKRQKYRDVTPRYRFEPLAIETTGVLGPSSLKFVHELGSRVRECTGERRETQWLLQRLSLAVVRGNAAAVLASGRAIRDRQGG